MLTSYFTRVYHHPVIYRPYLNLINGHTDEPGSNAGSHTTLPALCLLTPLISGQFLSLSLSIKIFIPSQYHVSFLELLEETTTTWVAENDRNFLSDSFRSRNLKSRYGQGWFL
jgi:hypothetical protein